MKTTTWMAAVVAMAAGLALGKPLQEAAWFAKRFVLDYLRKG